MSHSNQGQAVGTGARGGVLISDGQGGTTEVFQSRPDQPSDPGRTRFIRRGGGGSGTSIAQAQAQAEAQRRAEEQARLQAEEQARAEEQRRQKAITEQKQFETTVRFRKKPTAQEERLQMSIPEQKIVTISPSTTTRNLIEERDSSFSERFRIGLSDKEKEMSKKEVIKGRFKEVGEGIAKTGISTVEGAINLASQLGTQKLEIKEDGTLKDRKTFEFGGKLGEIRDLPSTTGSILGQSMVFAPLLAGGTVGFFSSASNVGVKTAFVESASAFTPLKVRSGTFGALQSQRNIQDLQFEVLSLKTQKGGTTFKTIAGKEKVFDDVFISSKQILKGSGDDVFGGAITDITAPKTTYRAGKFTETLETVRVESIIKGQPGKVTRTKGFDSLKLSEVLSKTGGTKGDIISRTKSVIEISPKGLDAEFFGGLNLEKSIVGGVSRQIKPGFTGFGSGRGRTQIKVDSSGIKRNIKVERFNIKGVEIDLDAFTQKGLTKKINLKQKSQKTITKTSDLISGSIEQLKPTTTIIKTPKPLMIQTPSQVISTPSIQIVTQPLQIVTQTSQKLSVTKKRLTTPTTLEMTRTQQKSLIKVKTGQRFQTKTKQKQKQKPLQITKQTPSLKTAQKSAQALKLQLKTIQIQKPQPSIFIGVSPKKPRTPISAGFGFKLGKRKKKKKKGGLFTVEVRRKGEFKTVGITGDISKAVSIGKGITASTLGATFRIKGAKKGSVGIPAGFRLPKASSKIAGPLTFIEKSKFRLSKAGEIGEIQRAKRIKTTKRKKKR